MADVAFVYLPDDEPDSQYVNGVKYDLVPNGTTEIRGQGGLSASAVAEHIAAKLRQWGVVRVSGPVVDGQAKTQEDQELVAAAEATYLRATKEWAEAIVMARVAVNKPRTDAGLHPIPRTEDETKAERWLEAKAGAMKADGLV